MLRNQQERDRQSGAADRIPGVRTAPPVPAAAPTKSPGFSPSSYPSREEFLLSGQADRLPGTPVSRTGGVQPIEPEEHGAINRFEKQRQHQIDTLSGRADRVPQVVLSKNEMDRMTESIRNVGYQVPKEWPDREEYITGFVGSILGEYGLDGVRVTLANKEDPAELTSYTVTFPGEKPSSLPLDQYLKMHEDQDVEHRFAYRVTPDRMIKSPNTKDGWFNYEMDYPTKKDNFFGTYSDTEVGYHTGIDYNTIQNNDKTFDDSVVSINDGVVQYIRKDGANGNMVVVRHKINGAFYYSSYSHLDKIVVSVGDRVFTGSSIGVMGNTGNSRGKHLHLAVYTRYVNGKTTVNVSPSGYTNGQPYCNNGYIDMGYTRFYDPIKVIESNGMFILNNPNPHMK